MDKPNLKIYLFISIALVILIIFALFYSLNARKRSQNVSPTPAIQITGIDEIPTDKITPVYVQPTDFTGVLEEELPPDIQALSEQKMALKNVVPVTESQFGIEFDYGEDKFRVNLNEPKDQALSSFESWLNNNYPAIPIDRFIVN